MSEKLENQIKSHGKRERSRSAYGAMRNFCWGQIHDSAWLGRGGGGGAGGVIVVL